MKNTKIIYLCVAVLLGLLFFLNVFSIMQISETSDEALHLEYGKRILRCNPARWKNDHDSVMPFSAFNILPESIGKLLDNMVPSKKHLVFFMA